MSKKITQDRFKQAEFVRQVYSATVPEGVTKDDILDPAFWAHVAAGLAPRSRIEVWAETGEWYAELMVLSCSRTHAKVLPLFFKQIEENAAPEENDAFTIAWKGAVKKYCVIRKEDKEVVKDGFDDRTAATQWLVQYQETQLA